MRCRVALRLWLVAFLAATAVSRGYTQTPNPSPAPTDTVVCTPSGGVAETCTLSQAYQAGKAGQGISEAQASSSLQAAINIAPHQVDVGASTPTTAGWLVNGATPYSSLYDSIPPGSVQAAGTNVFDRRFGAITHACWDAQTSSIWGGGAGGYCEFKIGNFIKSYPFGEHGGTELIINNAISGGFNTNFHKTTYETLISQIKSYTPAQRINVDAVTNCYSVGDCLAYQSYLEAEGGANAAEDEGIEPLNFETVYGNANYVSTIASSAGVGALSITMAAPASNGNGGTQGAGRFLMDVSSSQCSTSNTITSISTATGQPTVMHLGVASDCPVSSAHTTTTAAITNNNTPTAVDIPVVSSSGFSTGSLIAIGDDQSYETTLVTAVPDGTHVRAVLTKAHGINAAIGQGGAAGDVVTLAADTYPSGGFLGVFSVSQPVPRAWPVIYSDAQNLYVWISGDGVWSSYIGQASTGPGATNAFNVYPAAEVLDVSNGTGAPTNTFTLAPNSGSWAAGDTVNLPPYPFQKTSWGHLYYAQTYPTPAGQGGGFNLSYGGIWTSNDRLFGVTNQTNSAIYRGNGHTGALNPPNAAFISGSYTYDLVFDKAPFGSMLFSFYDNLGASGGPVNLVFIGNASGNYDGISYNSQAPNEYWTITAASRSSKYDFTPGGLKQDNVPYVRETVGSIVLPTTAIAAGSCASGTLSIGGATTTMNVVVNPTSYPGDQFDWGAYVSASGVVTVRMCNRGSASAAPIGTGGFNVRVLN